MDKPSSPGPRRVVLGNGLVCLFFGASFLVWLLPPGVHPKRPAQIASDHSGEEPVEQSFANPRDPTFHPISDHEAKGSLENGKVAVVETAVTSHSVFTLVDRLLYRSDPDHAAAALMSLIEENGAEDVTSEILKELRTDVLGRKEKLRNPTETASVLLMDVVPDIDNHFLSLHYFALKTQGAAHLELRSLLLGWPEARIVLDGLVHLDHRRLEVFFQDQLALDSHVARSAARIALSKWGAGEVDKRQAILKCLVSVLPASDLHEDIMSVVRYAGAEKPEYGLVYGYALGSLLGKLVTDVESRRPGFIDSFLQTLRGSQFVEGSAPHEVDLFRVGALANVERESKARVESLRRLVDSSHEQVRIQANLVLIEELGLSHLVDLLDETEKEGVSPFPAKNGYRYLWAVLRSLRKNPEQIQSVSRFVSDVLRDLPGYPDTLQCIHLYWIGYSEYLDLDEFLPMIRDLSVDSRVDLHTRNLAARLIKRGRDPLRTDPTRTDEEGRQRLSAEIRKAEMQLENIKIRGSSFSEKWDEHEGWIRTNERSFTAWYPGAPNGKRKIDNHRAVSISEKWGRVTRSYSDAFNGRTHMNLRRMEDRRNPSSRLRGTIKARKGGVTRWWSPCWSGTLYGFSEGAGQGISLSEMLVRCKEKVTVIPDGEFLEIQVSGENRPPLGGGRGFVTMKRWVLLPGKSYAIQTYETLNVEGKAMIRITGSNFLEPSPGVFYPMEGSRERFNPDGSPDSRLLFTAVEVVANDPAWSDDVFSLKWPEGTAITDHISGGYEWIEPREEEESFQKIAVPLVEKIGSVLGADGVRSDSDGLDEVRLPPRGREPLSGQKQQRTASWQPIVACAFFICGLAGFLFLRRNKNRYGMHPW